MIKRADNGKVGIPAGAFEENETIRESVIREVKEETGIDIMDLEVIGISSHPGRETVEYENGDSIQYFTVEFYSNKWKGTPQAADRNEVKDVKFVELEKLEALPENERSALESLRHYRQHNKIMLK